ncbi:hypothetical protein [Natrinema caseinilyticum]|uniref:hypothetical protein n=1 Tax=Natrinema caseinilyticum TaxID=2961570 RepID=UPI0020C3D8E0|nr:hypothetical protein [Natrinema caseinilyticum]
MDSDLEHTPVLGWQQAVEWQYETARAILKQSLEVQRAGVDSWLNATKSVVPSESPQREQLRRLEWGYDIWEETLLNILIHLDDAISEEGIDLRQLQMICLHAMDDAFSEVASRPVFAEDMNDTLEEQLTEQRQLNQLRRDVLHALNLPTDRSLEEVGKWLLQMEARQKKIEEKLDAILEAADIEGEEQFKVIE